MENLDFTSYPILLSEGLARLHLPPKLTKKDVERILKMLESLVIEEEQK